MEFNCYAYIVMGILCLICGCLNFAVISYLMFCVFRLIQIVKGNKKKINPDSYLWKLPFSQGIEVYLVFVF